VKVGPFKGIRTNWLFNVVTLGSLIALVAFLLLAILSLGLFVDWNIFLSAIVSREIFFAIRLSLVTATIAAGLAMIFAIPASYALSKREFRGKNLVDTLLDIPIVISPVAFGSALLIFFNTPLGTFIENHFLQFVFEVPGIVLAQFRVATALAIRLMKSTFDSIGQRYEIVARTLGYSSWKAFLKVTLPIAKNGVIAAGILAWARAVGEYGATVTLAGATQMKTETLPIAIYLNIASAEVDRAVAVTFILIGLSGASLVVLRRMTGKGYSL
jgi:molybdate transport system permease protein